MNSFLPNFCHDVTDEVVKFLQIIAIKLNYYLRRKDIKIKYLQYRFCAGAQYFDSLMSIFYEVGCVSLCLVLYFSFINIIYLRY